MHRTGLKKYLRGYQKGCRRAGLSYLHKLILKECEVDHVNGNGLDNRRQNLRACSRSQNNANRRGVRGYWYCKKLRSYRAEVWKDGKKHYVGCFKTQEEASAAYLTKKRELHGSFVACDNNFHDNKPEDLPHLELVA